jgi:ubiquitin-like protein Pup
MEPTAWLPMQQGKGENMVRIQEQLKHHRKDHHRHDHGEEETPIAPTEHGSADAGLKHNLDEILDEIDSVLEDNAEGFGQEKVRTLPDTPTFDPGSASEENA